MRLRIAMCYVSFLVPLVQMCIVLRFVCGSQPPPSNAQTHNHTNTQTHKLATDTQTQTHRHTGMFVIDDAFLTHEAYSGRGGTVHTT